MLAEQILFANNIWNDTLIFIKMYMHFLWRVQNFVCTRHFKKIKYTQKQEKVIFPHKNC